MISVDELIAALSDQDELALLDVREQGTYSNSHILWAANLPRSTAELRIGKLVPRLSTRIVLVDEDLVLAADVKIVLEQMGYSNVNVLEGGIAAWSNQGQEVYSGVNVPSKLFGELVESRYSTPHVSAHELQNWIDSDKKLVVLDSRTNREYRTMNIPTSRSCPVGELVYRIFDVVEDDTTIVVNCAGRTRSIMGAQSLINAGVSNEIFALENGTMGWELAGLTLKYGASESVEAPSEKGQAQASEAAERVRRKDNIEFITEDSLRQWVDDHAHTTYLLDVRSSEEYSEAHLNGFRSAPGGQLVQATDEYMATLGAKVVLADDDYTRATMSASWLKQMGWDVFIYEHGALDRELVAGLEEIELKAPAVPNTSSVGNSLIIDLSTSAEHRRGHIPGAIWSVRGRLSDLAQRLSDPNPKSIILTAKNKMIPALAYEEAQKAWPDAEVRVLEEWYGEEEQGLDTDEIIDDLWILPYDPVDAEVAREAMIGYLVWEVDLVGQYERDSLANYELRRAV